MAAGCAKNPGVKITPQPDRASAAAKLTPANYPKFKFFNTAGDAVAELVQVFDPQLIAFGEFHNEVGGNFRSPSLRFGEEILPVLKSAGFRDLVLEFAPDTEQAAVELSLLHRTGKVNAVNTPTLMHYAAGTDQEGILSIYNNAGGIRIYGGNTNPEEDETPGIQPKKYGPIVGRRTKAAADALLGDNSKVITYNGTDHNDVHPSPENVNDSFGPYFNAKCSYLAVDLIVPEMIGGYPMDDRSSDLYRPLVPKNGVLLYRRSGRDFSLIFARSK
jgi:hypothetical protein